MPSLLFMIALFLSAIGAWHVTFIPDTQPKKILKYVLLGCWITGAGIIWFWTLWFILPLFELSFSTFIFSLMVATVWTGVTAGLFLFASWLRLGAGHRKRESLSTIVSKIQTSSLAPEVKSQHLRQVALSYLAILALGVPTILMILSCWVSSCQNDLIRARIIFILIGCMLVIDQLFTRLRVTGKNAVLLVILIAAITLFLIGKVSGFV